MEFSLFGISSRGREAWKAGWARRDVRDALSFPASAPLLVPSVPIFGDNLGFTPFQQLLRLPWVTVWSLESKSSGKHTGMMPWIGSEGGGNSLPDPGPKIAAVEVSQPRGPFGFWGL